jgi:hypothetical protein
MDVNVAERDRKAVGWAKKCPGRRTHILARPILARHAEKSAQRTRREHSFRMARHPPTIRSGVPRRGASATAGASLQWHAERGRGGLSRRHRFDGRAGREAWDEGCASEWALARGNGISVALSYRAHGVAFALSIASRLVCVICRVLLQELFLVFGQFLRHKDRV